MILNVEIRKWSEVNKKLYHFFWYCKELNAGRNVDL